jgi:hypothetical protein
VTPPCPPPPFPPSFPPWPIYYDPFPRTYIIDAGNEEQQPMSRTRQYIDYLRKSIDALENAYDNAINDFMLLKAYRISQQINDLKENFRRNSDKIKIK